MKKPILIGAEFFEEIIEGGYFYVDKTLFIKELLENKGKITLITRPRRFGKTLNMNMLECFFDVNTDSKSLFAELKIAEHKDIIEKHMNKYPVIFLTLKNVESTTYEKSIENIKLIIAGICRENRYLRESEKLDEEQKEIFYTLLSGKSTENELKSALRFLTECLYTHHQKRAIILLDEYDTPITNALTEGYYPEMIKFMRGFMGNVFKTNKYLEFGVLTGVQRISKESLVSSFNNPKVCGIMDKQFADCFGFTETEVKEACENYGVSGEFEKVEQWYNGYRFGGQDIYNPWSITGYLDENRFKNYWVNTGGINVLADIFIKGTTGLKDDMAGLLTGTPVKMTYTERITYPIIYENDSVFWSMLLNTGYIKPCAGAEGDSFYAELVNREVRNVFGECIGIWLNRRERETPRVIQKFVECLLNGDKDGVSAALNDELLNSPGCHDFKQENSYHMFIFGILLAAENDYTVYSNAETGKGRSDCLIKPHDKTKYAVVIEFKHKSADGADLTEEARAGLAQINEKEYIHTLRREGYERVYKYGIAFHKKSCGVAMEAAE